MMTDLESHTGKQEEHGMHKNLEMDIRYLRHDEVRKYLKCIELSKTRKRAARTKQLSPSELSTTDTL